MKYKVKIQLACPYDSISPSTLYIIVDQSALSYLFGTTLPLPYSIFKGYVSSSTAQRYRKYFSDDDFALFTVLSVTLFSQL